jgi:hypothetical protein
MKEYVGVVEVKLHNSWPRQQMEVSGQPARPGRFTPEKELPVPTG